MLALEETLQAVGVPVPYLCHELEQSDVDWDHD